MSHTFRFYSYFSTHALYLPHYAALLFTCSFFWHIQTVFQAQKLLIQTCYACDHTHSSPQVTKHSEATYQSAWFSHAYLLLCMSCLLRHLPYIKLRVMIYSTCGRVKRHMICWVCMWDSFHTVETFELLCLCCSCTPWICMQHKLSIDQVMWMNEFFCCCLSSLILQIIFISSFFTCIRCLLHWLKNHYILLSMAMRCHKITVVSVF